MIECSLRSSEPRKPRDSASSIGSSQKLRVALGLLYVDVARLVSFAAEEKKAIAADAQDFGHAQSLATLGRAKEAKNTKFVSAGR